MYIILNVVRIIASHVSCFYGKAIAKGDPGFQYYQYTDLTDSAAFAEYMERAHPMAPSSGIEQAQYAVEASANSVFWHEHGSWIDFKYAKFLYRDKLYYVNVSPTVQLTQSMYDRKGDLNNMAKIMVCLAKQAGTDRDTLVFTLDGNLYDQT